LLKLAKMNAGSVAYYESDVERTPAAIGSDLTDYYSETGARRPQAWAVGRDPEKVAVACDRLGVRIGEDPGREAIEGWFNQAIAPSGEKLGRAPQGPRTSRIRLKTEDGKPLLGVGGGQLTKTRTDGGTVRGYDLVFASPKSVSIAWAIGDEQVQQAILESRDLAINSAMDYLSRHAGYTRQRMPGHDQAVIVEADALAGVRYEHRTSRALDPHLHDHVLMSGKVLNSVTGEWTALDGNSLYYESKAAGTIFQATYRAAITERLGWAWDTVDPAKGYAELAGVSRETIERWSKRSSEIDDWCSEHGAGKAPASQAKAQRITREAKDLSKTDEELCAEWRQLVAALDGDVLGGIGRHQAGERVTPDALVDAMLEQLSAHQSTFTRAELCEYAAGMVPLGVVPPERVVEVVEQLADDALGTVVSLQAPAEQGDVLTRRLEDGRPFGTREGHVRYTTKAMLELEANSTERAVVRVAGLASNPHQVEQGRLDFAQLRAARQLVASDQRASCLIAPAGAGKTTTLRSARVAWEADRRTVHGIAPTGRAAKELADAAATSSSSTPATIATVLGKMRRGESTGWKAGDVVLLDEAGMVGSLTLAQLLAQAERDGARLVMIGDPNQLQPIKEASGLFELLAEDLPDTARLETVHRQVNPDEGKATLGLMADASEAEAAAAVDWYSSNDRILAGDPATMREQALDMWAQLTADGGQAMILTDTVETADALGAVAQARLVEAGRVDHSRTVAIGQVDTDTGEVIGHQRLGGVGDLIVAKKNAYDLHTSAGGDVRNGSTWTITGINGPEGAEHVTLTSTQEPPEGALGPERVVVPADWLAEHSRLGYAVTAHAAQGATTDFGILCGNADTMDSHLLYVGMTRGRRANAALLFQGAEGGHPDDHDHGAKVERFYATDEEAAQLMLDITGRGRRDKSAHQTAEDAAKAGYKTVADRYGVDEADLALQRAVFTDVDQAAAARLRRRQHLGGEDPGLAPPGQAPGMGR
jgi:conjugative relaxase-like TrwC/TraI family protein